MINFKLISHLGEVLVEKDETNEINDLEIKEKGLYVFKFKNSMNSSSKLTFAFDSGYIDEEKKIITNENIKQIFDKIKKPKKQAKKLNNMSSTFHLKYINHLVEAKKHNKSIIVFSLIECAVMIMVFYFQTKFLMGLLDKI